MAGRCSDLCVCRSSHAEWGGALGDFLSSSSALLAKTKVLLNTPGASPSFNTLLVSWMEMT